MIKITWYDTNMNKRTAMPCKTEKIINKNSERKKTGRHKRKRRNWLKANIGFYSRAIAGPEVYYI